MVPSAGPVKQQMPGADERNVSSNPNLDIPSDMKVGSSSINKNFATQEADGKDDATNLMLSEANNEYLDIGKNSN